VSITELEILLEETDSLITQMTISDDNVEMGDLLTQYCDLWDKIYDFANLRYRGESHAINTHPLASNSLIDCFARNLFYSWQAH
jgi:hypothetical protein